jgi:hypothetical protein
MYSSESTLVIYAVGACVILFASALEVMPVTFGLNWSRNYDDFPTIVRFGVAN